MKGRWRLFRHEGGRAAGPPPWVYVALFCACMLVGLWSAARFGAIVIWPANGVMLAALLQLHRRQAVRVIAVCFTINIVSNVVRGDPMPFLLLNPLSNLIQVSLAAVLARRVCGAALDLRRPKRLANFAFLAVLPAVGLTAFCIVTLGAVLRDLSLPIYLFTLHRYFDMELLGLLIVAPTLLLMARAHRFQGLSQVSRVEVAALIGLLVAITALTFFQNRVPLLFLVFPPIVLIVFRLSPPWSALSCMLVATIGAIATLMGHGPITMTILLDIPGLEAVDTLQRQLSIYYLFLLAVMATTLPISAMMSERHRLVARLKARTQAAQAARRRAEAADAAKSRFLALMSHEMRTPLHSVVGYAEVLARRMDITSEAREQVELIQQSGNGLLMLVEDVLEVSRGDEIACMDTVLLCEILSQAAAPSREIAAIKGLTLRLETRTTGPVVCDRRRLRQAVHKLIANAVKFTAHGEVVVTADRDGDDVVITVVDTGPGIDPALKARLFEAFVQGDDSIARDQSGAGMGLTVVRRHAERMGGTVCVESQPGQGSRFTLRLPLAPADQITDADVPAEAPAMPPPPRVLVVDDHPANREVARLMLAPLGCEIVEAVDGIDALERVQVQTFDLILMDVRMPRMDGIAATRAIRALPAPFSVMPILAVTADAMPEDAARCLAAGMNGHLAKPITHASLYAAIDLVMASDDPTDAEAA